MEREWPNPHQATLAFCVAVAMLGADMHDLDGFLRYMEEQGRTNGHVEFRVCPKLGAGGKLRFNDIRGFHVNMYPESETPDRMALQYKANRALVEIWEPIFSPYKEKE